MPKKSLLILPFDHRSSFATNILGYKLPVKAKKKKNIIKLKNIVYQGFLEAWQQSDCQNSLGILVDEEYGRQIIKDAKKNKIILAIPVEKSGKEIFEFEFGNNFAEHLKKIKPDYVKALVRYNPENVKINVQQIDRLKTLSNFCHKNDFKLILELLVPPTKDDLEAVRSVSAYDKTLRLKRTIDAISELKKDLHVVVWKLEGFERGIGKVVAACGVRSKIIILGRGGGLAQVKRWLKVAKKYPQVIGFAIGRTIFQSPLERFRDKKITQDQAAHEINKRYLDLINYWFSK